MHKTYRARILVVDDEIENLQGLQKILEHEAYEVISALSGSAALALLRKTNVDLVVSDLRMPEMNGLELLRSLRKFAPECPVIMLTAFGTVDDAVEAMKLGAIDFLSKPIRRSQLLRVVDQALTRVTSLSTKGDQNAILGASSVINELRRSVHMLAPSDAPVLIRGESGTGKELIAQALHHASGRRGKIVSINCGAIPSALLESELFGYVRGAFTGASGEKAGLFEDANEGTLFLDEIGELPSELQVKLLRVLETKKIRRLGGLQEKSVNFRVLAATNADLEAKIRSGEFREDLFYRLNVICLVVPALRDRGGDSILLAEHLLAQACERYHKEGIRLSVEAKQAIEHYTWPGNVRELKNVIERATVLCSQKVISQFELRLLEPPRGPSSNLRSSKMVSPVAQRLLSFPVGTSLEEIEREVIKQTLAFYEGDKKKTAEVLGINLRTIYRKMDSLSGIREESGV